MTFSDLNNFGKRREPFFFMTDFKAEQLEIFTLNELKKNNIEFSINENFTYKSHNHLLQKTFPSFSTYKKSFQKVIEKIESGETYVLNLTQSTKIKSDLTLNKMYTIANAHYKLRFKDKFICFSPEKFIQIKKTSIHTYPMKGTIDASIENAKAKILQDKKELAEHTMIVDLLRNDLSIVAKDVKVERFRYITEVQAGKKTLLQVSSHISGNIGTNWHENIGTILQNLLPAGSISGAPKKSTVSIIENVEDHKREYFSGIFGFYDGKELDSGVMIRFIQKTEQGYIYKSGGGITLDSDPLLEYNELLDKIYLP